MNSFALFTDVSLNPELKLGVGGYLVVPTSFLEILPDRVKRTEVVERMVIRKFEGTSSTKLEVQTVLWAIEDYKKKIKHCESEKLHVYSDSQCVSGLLRRRPRLEGNEFFSKNTRCPLKNASLYLKFYELYDELHFEIIKVSGHSQYRSHDTVHRIFSFVDREVRKSLSLWMNG